MLPAWVIESFCRLRPVFASLTRRAVLPPGRGRVRFLCFRGVQATLHHHFYSMRRSPEIFFHLVPLAQDAHPDKRNDDEGYYSSYDLGIL